MKLKRYHFNTSQGIFVYRATKYENALKRVKEDFKNDFVYLGYQDTILGKLKK